MIKFTYLPMEYNLVGQLDQRMFRFEIHLVNFPSKSFSAGQKMTGPISFQVVAIGGV